MRFDDQNYLDAFRDKSAYPMIHTPFFNFIFERVRGRRIVDLCCSTGLLGQRLKEHMPWAEVIGIEGNESAIKRAKLAGVRIPLERYVVTPESMPALIDMLKSFKPDVLIARRCIPELFGKDLAFGAQFATCMQELNVNEIFLQGRVPTCNARNALNTVEKEAQIFEPHYCVSGKMGQLMYLKRKVAE